MGSPDCSSQWLLERKDVKKYICLGLYMKGILLEVYSWQNEGLMEDGTELQYPQNIFNTTLKTKGYKGRIASAVHC